MSPKTISLINELYEGGTRRGVRFRYALLIMDVLTLLFLVLSSFFHGNDLIEYFDLLFGSYIVLDFGARFLVAAHKGRFLVTPLNIVDMVVIFSFFAPIVGENFAFLRVLRIFRMLHTPIVLKALRSDWPRFRLREDIMVSSANLVLFIFAMTELVFVTQKGRNPDVNNFIDALYFTVTTLTTTGFGDIVLIGHTGRLLAVIIMIFGVSLFLRLIQTILRPSKVRYSCPQCGLFLHERDSVHCKHCGHVLILPQTDMSRRQAVFS